MSVSAGWVALSEQNKKSFNYYRKNELYSMKWNNLNLSDLRVVACSYGGPIATFKNPSLLDVGKDAGDTQEEAGGSSSQVISIFTSSGSIISQFEWKAKNRGDDICDVGWTPDMKLVLVTAGGTLALFSVHGTQIFIDDSVSKLPLDEREQIVACRFQGKALAIYTSNNDVYVCEDITQLLSVVTAPEEKKEDALDPKQAKQKKSAKKDKQDKPKVQNRLFRKFNSPSFDPAPEKNKFPAFSCMEVIPVTGESKGEGEASVRVILCFEQTEGFDIKPVYIVSDTEEEAKELNVDKGAGSDKKIKHVTRIQLSPDGTLLALYAVPALQDSGKKNVPPTEVGVTGLFVFKRDIMAQVETVLELYTVEGKQRSFELPSPDQIAFCGNECIVLSWGPNAVKDESSLLLMTNLSAETKPLNVEGSAYLHQEVDCIRIITNNSLEILEKVDTNAVKLFRIGSLKPGALLYDAYSEYLKGKPSAIKTIREIKNKVTLANYAQGTNKQNINPLQKAINQCLDAACREFDPDVQQQLLKAAAYGKTFVHDLETDAKKNSFIDKVKQIRVLNEVRKDTFGLALTYDQLMSLSTETLVGRLVELRFHSLAFRICKFLNLEKLQTRILLHWACVKVVTNAQKPRSQNLDEALELDTVYNTITQKLRDHSQAVSFAEVASTAYKIGNKKLAKRLLRDDRKPVAQIPLYLNMHETNLAITEAIRSRSTDLIYLVILYMINILKDDPKYLYEVISEQEQVERLFITYCKNEDVAKLEHFYKGKGEYRGVGTVQISEAYQKKEKYDQFQSSLIKARDTLSGGDEKTMADLTDNQSRLLEMQKKLESYIDDKQRGKAEKTKVNIVGLSLHDTMYVCVINGMEEKALKLKEKFDVSDKRFWWIMVKALTKLKVWPGLWAFSQSFKPQSSVFSFIRGNTGPTSPIGFAPFVDACLESDEEKTKKEKEAMRYIPLVENAQQKVDYYIRLVKFKEAVEVTVELKDAELLRYVRSKTKNAKTVETIDSLLKEWGYA